MLRCLKTQWPTWYRWLSLQCTFSRILLLIALSTVLYIEFLSHWLCRLRWANLYIDGSSKEDQVKILFVADPQLVGLQDESKDLGFITRWDSDRYMAHTFSHAVSHTQPDVVIFLGDLIDEGSKATENEYYSYIRRFMTAFSVPDHVKRVYIPGDNDVGGEGFDIKTEPKVQRFNQHFLPTVSPGQDNSVINVKFVDFLRFNWDDGETFDGQTRRKAEALAAKSTAPVKVLLNHMSLLMRSRFEVNPARIMTCLDCLDDPRHLRPKDPIVGGGSRVRDYSMYTFNIKNSKAVNEIMVPTCSYRMGVLSMGYGAALIDKKGTAVYSVLWTPSRYPQLFAYLVILALLAVVIVLRLGHLLFTRQQNYTKRHAYQGP